MTPKEAAALYLWAVDDGNRVPPEDPDEMRLVGRALGELAEIAGDEIPWEAGP